MQIRSVHSKRWIAKALIAASLLVLLAGGAMGATLSGNLIDHSNYSQGVYHVYAVRLNLDSPIVGSTSVIAPGPWQITGVPSGHYFLLAWRDVNRNFVPSRGEPMGFFGVPFPSRVTVQSSNIGNLDVVLDATNLGAEVVGNVCYPGTKRGRIWVVPHISPDLELTTVRGTPWTMTSPGEYQTFIMDHGRYFITAFIDLNGNLVHDEGEPHGVSGPIDIVVTPGVTYRYNLCMTDGSTAVEGSTWSRVKDMYR